MFCEDVLWNTSAVEPLYGYPRISKCFRDTIITFVITFLVAISSFILFTTRRHKNALNLKQKATFSSFLACLASLCLVICIAIQLILEVSATPQIASSILSNVLHICNVLVMGTYQLISFPNYVRNRGFLSLLWTVYFLCWLPNVYESLLFESRLAFLDITICFLIIVELLVCLLTIPGKNEDISSQSEQSSLLSNLLMLNAWSILVKCYRSTLTLQHVIEMPDVLNLKEFCPETSFTNFKFRGVVCTMFFWKFFALTTLLTLFFLLRHILTAILLGFMIDSLQNSEPLWKQYSYVALMSVVLIISSIIYSHANMHLFIIGIKVKTMVFVYVYRKVLRVSKYERQNVSIGALTNVLIVDVERFVLTTKLISIGIASVVLAIAAFITLYFYIGYATIATAILFCVTTPLYSFINKQSSKYLENLYKLKSDRLKIANEMLNGIKIIKLHAWEPAITKALENIRFLEYCELRKFGLWQALLRSITFNGALSTALVGFTVYSFLNDIVVIDVKITFISVSLFLSLRQSGLILPQMSAMIYQAQMAFNFLDNFFEMSELSVGTANYDNSKDKHCVVLNNTAFKRTEHDKIALDNISFSIEGSKLFTVVGPVAGGKSTLLEAILGELRLVRGIRHVSSSIAYVPQVPWIQNTTIKQNILFAKEYNQRKYQEVLAACCLNDDLKAFSHGDETIIGERGVQLSGGQKQRISIARAIYQDCDIYLLDDPFSALDSEVGMSIFQFVFSSNGILKNKLRILVTNNLGLAQCADFVYLINNGKIAFGGKSNRLHDKLNVFDETNCQVKKSDNVEILFSTHKKFHSELEMQKIQNFDEQVAEGSVTAHIFIKYIKYFGTYAFLLTLTLAAVCLILEMFSGYWLSLWTRDNFESSYQTRTIRLGVYAATVLLVGVIFTIFSVFIYTNFPKANTKIHKEMLSSILHSPLLFFNRTPTGRILNRLGNDIDQLDMQPCLATVSLQFVCQIIGMLVTTCLILPTFVIPALCLFLCFVFIQRITAVSDRQCKRLESVTRSNMANQLIETMQGADSIRAYSATNMFAQKTEQLCRNNTKCVYYTRTIESCVTMYTSLLTDFVLACLLVLMLGSFQSSDQGTLIFVICYAVNTVYAFALTVTCVNELETSFISAERLFEYCSLPSEAPWRVSKNLVSDSWPKHGAIKFCNYTSCYEAGLQPVLRNINLTIASGKKVGIVGRTGAGKSSLILSLFRVLEAIEGSIWIDGVDISTIGLHDLRSKLTIIPQDPVLFSGTLRTNLDLTGSHTDEELFEAVKAAHIENLALRNGLDTVIDEFGGNLSVGQRQLMCLARAILSKTSIVVMDEATSSVDLQTDALMQQTIVEQFNSCTVLMIAHRIETIINYDTVIVLDHGTVVEMGNPRELADRNDTQFAKLARLSSNGKFGMSVKQ